MAKALGAFGAALIVALALVVAGCGGSSSSSGSSHSSTSTGPANAGGQSASAFQACLAQHGVKLRSGFGNGQPPQGGGAPPQGGGAPPQGGGQPPSFSAKQQKAFAACRGKMPAGASASGGFPGGGQTSSALKKYTSCLRQHGVTFSGSNNQSAFKKASAACAKYAPSAGG
jgi:hypothetical protein